MANKCIKNTHYFHKKKNLYVSSFALVNQNGQQKKIAIMTDCKNENVDNQLSSFSRIKETAVSFIAFESEKVHHSDCSRDRVQCSMKGPQFQSVLEQNENAVQCFRKLSGGCNKNGRLEDP